MPRESVEKPTRQGNGVWPDTLFRRSLWLVLGQPVIFELNINHHKTNSMQKEARTLVKSTKYCAVLKLAPYCTVLNVAASPEHTTNSLCLVTFVSVSEITWFLLHFVCVYVLKNGPNYSLTQVVVCVN